MPPAGHFRSTLTNRHGPGPSARLKCANSGRPDSGNALYLCIPLSSLLMPCASARTIERRREIFILAGAMKRMLILAVTLWLGVSATAHAQVNSPTNSPTNAASTVTGAIVPSGQAVTGATGGGFIPFVPVLQPCPFGVSLSAILTAFGCASDPLSAPTYQISAGAGVVITGPVGSISANAQTVTPNATSAAGGTSGGVSSRAGCLGAIPSTAGSVGAGGLFGGIGGC
jgi:hypothetical protein